MIAQGEVWWADLPAPTGSESRFRRPVVVVQGDSFNRSALRTVVCVVLTSNLKWADAPGNVLLAPRATGLPRDSVANVSQVITLDKTSLTERAGRLPRPKLGGTSGSQRTAPASGGISSRRASLSRACWVCPSGRDRSGRLRASDRRAAVVLALGSIVGSQSR